MSEAMFYRNCFIERGDLYTKAVLRFYCSLIYKLKLMTQNVIFCSFFSHKKMIFKGNNSCMNKCIHVSNNHNIQFFKIKFQNNFRPIANIFSNYCIITNFKPVFPILAHLAMKLVFHVALLQHKYNNIVEV